MSAGGSSSESESQSAPWIGQQPFLTDLYSQAQGFYNQGVPGYYPGATYTPFNDVQQQAMQQTVNMAANQAPYERAFSDYMMMGLTQPQFSLAPAGMAANQAAGGVGMGQGFLSGVGTPGIDAASRFSRAGSSPFSQQTILNQGYGGPQDAQNFIGGPSASYDPYASFTQQQISQQPSLQGRINQFSSTPGNGMFGGAAGAGQSQLEAAARGDFVGANPYLDQMADAAAARTTEQFTDSVMPGINATFGAAGRTGSGLQSEALTDAAGELGDTLSRQNANIYGNAYAQERQAQDAAAGQLGQLGLAGGRLGLDAAGLGAQVYEGDAARRLGAAGLGADITGAQNADQLSRSQSALDTYLAERGLGQQANQFGASNALAQNTLAADLYNQGQDRQLQAGQNLLTGGLSGANTMGGLFDSVGAYQQGAAGFVPTFNDMLWNDIDRIRGVGDDVQGLSNQVLQDDINRYNYNNIQGPRDLMEMYAQIILGQQLSQSRSISDSDSAEIGF